MREKRKRIDREVGERSRYKKRHIKVDMCAHTHTKFYLSLNA